ncbi:MAG: 3-deoxy-D-manno-octulosonate 8-phosphate phosphatase [Saprospiraceae bacterium]|nr:3-deoxy-D-manno-octulosonate 8-phosphate phosphatase [Saprospiraceae bacterium]
MSVLDSLIHIKAFVFDVDGVMTDGNLLLTDEGHFLRTFNIRDGFAIRKAVDEGYLLAVISGGRSQGVEKRLRDLGVRDIFLGINDKAPVLTRWMNSNSITQNQLAYMGDDILDMVAMNQAILRACPADAVAEVKAIANYFATKPGGHGCVRELIEMVLKAQNRW